MTTPPTQLPERLAAVFFWLSQAMGLRSGWDRVLTPMLPLLIHRFQRIRLRFAALVARIHNGTYVVRHRASGPRPAPPPNPLPDTIGWLLPLLPGAANANLQLRMLFDDAEMQALLAAAPEAMGRLFRPLCRMLAVPVPDILAPPRRPQRPKPAKSPKPAAPPRRPTMPEPPAWIAATPRSAAWPKGVKLRKTR